IKNEDENKNDTNDNFSKDVKKIDDSAINFIFKDKIFLLFIIATIFFSFAYSQAGFTLPIFLVKIFEEDGAKIYGIIQSTNAITVILLTPMVSYLTKKKSAFLMVALAGVFYAVGFGLYGVFKIFPLFLLTTIIWSTGEIIQVTHQNVFVANRSPINIRGQLNGAFQILSGIGFLLGPVFSGFFQKRFNIIYVWLVVFLICLIGSLQLFISYKKVNN
ncbi:MAG TPA: MFS transporter, partial [Exilispira sp.]|nr:MFS transporter [Exilispira sp.]